MSAKRMQVGMVFLMGLVLPAIAFGQSLKTERQQYSYAIGVQVASSIKHDGVDLDVAAMQQAIADVMSGADLKLTEEQMRDAFVRLQEAKMKELQVVADKNLKAGQKFLASNAKQSGVKVLESGLQYSVIKAGKGKQPKAADTVVVHYKGTLINGEEFDSSYSRGEPATFMVNGVIQGWQEILPLMKVGAKWKVFIPSSLAYGERGTSGLIGPNAALVFDIELLEVK